MPETAAADLRETEALSGLRVTHIINNSNLGRETSSAHIEESLEYTREISRLIRRATCATMHSRIFCDAPRANIPT